MRKLHIASGLMAASLTVLGASTALAQTPYTPSPAGAQASARASAQAETRAQTRTPRQVRPAPAPVTRAQFVARRVDWLTALDANKDGVVSPEEMRAGMQARRAERTTAMFDRLDTNKDGQISHAEFEARGSAGRAGRPEASPRAGPRAGHARVEMRRGPQGQRGPIVIAEARTKAEQAFAHLDANHDGVVTADERRATRVAARQNRVENRAERGSHRGNPEGRGAHRKQTPASSSMTSPSAPASE